MKLRDRLVAFNAAQIALLGVVTFTVVIMVRERALPMLEQHLQDKTRTTVQALASQVQTALEEEDKPSVMALFNVLESDPDFAFAELTTAPGHLFARVGAPTDMTVLLHESARVHNLENSVAAWLPVVHEGRPGGRLVVAYHKDRLATVSWLLWLLSMAAVLGLFAAFGFAARFANSFLAPFGKMMEFTEAVAAGDLSRRLPVTGDEELKQLAEHFNTMADALEQRNGALTRRQTELEEALEALRTQDKLIQSTRLAAVGEMAGRTAHEVLNPITSIHGRLTKMRDNLTGEAWENRMLLVEILEAWKGDYDEEGFDGLFTKLSASVEDEEGQNRTLLDEDLENLTGIAAIVRDEATLTVEDINFLLGETERVTRIVDGMRSLTRQKSSPEVVSASEVVGRAFEVVRDALRKRHIEGVLEIDDDAEVWVDPFELIQLLTNLFRNGMQAIEEAHGHQGGTLTTRVDTNAHCVFVRIQDDGSGISDEHAPYVFEPNFTTRSAHEGTGIGLSICRRFARQFDGNLTLEHTSVGEGTTFLLELPRHESGEDSEVKAAA